MSSRFPYTAERSRPLVAVVSSSPVLRKRLISALGGLVEVRGVPAGGEVASFLRWLHPDAMVVDTEKTAAAAAQFAEESDTKLVRVAIHDAKPTSRTTDDWEEPVDDPFDAIRELSIAWTLERLR